MNGENLEGASLQPPDGPGYYLLTLLISLIQSVDDGISASATDDFALLLAMRPFRHSLDHADCLVAQGFHSCIVGLSILTFLFGH